MKKLVRNGIEGIFSIADIKSGQPQRYGWQEPGKEKKELPKEIIQFIERKRPVEQEIVSKEEIFEELEALSGEKIEIPIEKKIVPAKEIVVKPKAKKNDNPKQKDGGATKRKPGRVAKN